MTIITKAKTEKKFDKFSEKPLVVNNAGGTEFVDIRNGKNNLNSLEMDMWLSPSARRRISTSTTICVFITALLVMSICIIGGVYLYRQVTHQRMSRFRGWCGIPYERDTLHFRNKNYYRDYLLGPNKPFFKEDTNAEWFNPHNRFKEEFELDLESGLFERIDVPDFGYGRKGRFIHDFESNKTAIIDLQQKKCFIKQLDKENVKPPRSLFDMISKIWTGAYNVDTSVIQKTMEVVHPPIEDLNSQGKHIAYFCSNYPTFMLRIQNGGKVLRKRRGVDQTIDGEDDQHIIQLAEFAGKNIVEYTIIDKQKE